MPEQQPDDLVTAQDTPCYFCGVIHAYYTPCPSTDDGDLPWSK